MVIDGMTRVVWGIRIRVKTHCLREQESRHVWVGSRPHSAAFIHQGNVPLPTRYLIVSPSQNHDQTREF